MMIAPPIDGRVLYHGSRAAALGLGVAALLLLPGCEKSISGSYLASDQRAVCWLQLVQTPDNHVTGQLDALIMKPDGSVERDSISVTGASDGNNVSLKGSSFLGLESVMLSGSLQGDELALTGSQSLTAQTIPATFTRSSVTAYQAQVAELNARAQTIVRVNAAARAKAEAEREAAQARAEEEQIAAQNAADAEREASQAQMQAVNAVGNLVNAIDQTIAKMQTFDTEADVHLARFPGAEKTYQEITAKMAQCVETERQLAGNPNASLTRSRLALDASQASLLTDQVHNQVLSLQSTFRMNVEPIANELAVLEQHCAQPAPTDNTLAQTRGAACGRLSVAAIPFGKKYDAVASGLANLEQVYQSERSKQQRLLQTSESLE